MITPRTRIQGNLLARVRSGTDVLPDELEGGSMARRARTLPPVPSPVLLPGLSVGVAVHEPNRRVDRSPHAEIRRKLSGVL